MKHSNSWPAHVLAVKICVNPLRACTINVRKVTSESHIEKLKSSVSCGEHHSATISQLPRPTASPRACIQGQFIDQLLECQEVITLTLIDEQQQQQQQQQSVESSEPPKITVVDYDGATTWTRTRHACAKCQSEAFLKLQVDPFQSTSTSNFEALLNRPRSSSVDYPSTKSKKLDKRTQSLADGRRQVLMTNPRKETTLWRHYYPEGGWGFVIVTCSALVHFLGVGLQLAAPGTFYISAQLKFQHPPLHSSESPEVLRSYPELLNALLQYQSANSCSCRKDSSCSPSIVKYPGSGLSISTCQSSLPVTARNSTNALNHPHDPHRSGDLIFSNGRRHSDLMPWRLADNSPRRLSDQPLSLCHCNDSQSTSRPSSALDKTSNRSFSPDFKQNSIQRTLSRSSIGPITPKMMKRRFSEQLILEGGLSHEPEFDQLVDEEDAEESLTAANARKKVTLKRHFYPEGQWGYIVAVVAVIIQTICHGLQVGFGVLLGASVALFHTSIAETGIEFI